MMYDPFFTADLHFGHANAIKYCDRPFSDAHEMNKGIIKNWNAVVGANDEIYIIGDVSFSRLDQTVDMLGMLNGKKFLVAGNHDAKLRRQENFARCFEWVKDYHEMSIAEPDIPGGKQHLVLCHFPMLSWNRSHHGSFMLHGHCHGKLNNEQRDLKRHDCGIDANNYHPIRYSSLKTLFSHRRSLDIDQPTAQ